MRTHVFKEFLVLVMLVQLAVGCKPTHYSRTEDVYLQVDVAGAGRPLMDIVRETADSDAKWRAIRALGALQYKDASPLFIECLKDDHHYVRSNAARELGDMRIKTASDSLIRLLESEKNSGVIEQTSLALRLIGAREAVPALKQVSDHNSVQTRIWVLDAIGHLGSRDDVPFLADRLNASSLSEQEAAARGIEKLTEVDFGFPERSGLYNPRPVIDRARKWWKENKATFVSG